MPAKDLVLDNLVPAVGGLLVAGAVPLAAAYPAAASFIMLAAGALAAFLAKVYPGWDSAWLTKEPATLAPKQ